MIKIKNKDNIYDIIYKIDKEKSEKQIVLQIPFWHPVLYNYLALKSIKNKVWDKKLIISTTDIASKKIWKNLWIKYSISKDDDFISEEKNLLKYNYTFFEYLKYELKKSFNKILWVFWKNKKINDIKDKYRKYYKQKTNITFFIMLLTITILIFLYIFYFALNKTIVYVSPSIKVETKSKNFNFSEQVNSDTQQLTKISKTIELEETFKTTGIKQDEKYRAKWEAELINNLETPIKLLPNTRLLSENNIIYETLNSVEIPSAKENSAWEIIPWIIKVNIRSKFKDNNWIFTWSRWNLIATWSILSLPWLKENKDDIYAKTISPIIWWEDLHTNIVWVDDKENSEKLMLEKLKKSVIDSIYEEIEQKNEANNITYKVLWIDDIYDFKNIEINFEKDFKTWDELEEFKIRWIITADTYIYNIDSVISKLKTEIENWIIPEKEKILFINDKSIRISNVITRQERPFFLKATVEIEVFLSHNFENESDNYVKRLKNTIAWMSKTEAEKVLINEEKISNVEIEIRPFFLDHISNFFNNIKFVIEE